MVWGIARPAHVSTQGRQKGISQLIGYGSAYYVDELTTVSTCGFMRDEGDRYDPAPRL